MVSEDFSYNSWPQNTGSGYKSSEETITLQASPKSEHNAYISLTMAEPKTKPTQQSVDDFINSIEPEWKRDDAWEISKLMQKITGEKPVLWGPSIVGFGTYRYVYESGREGNWMLTGFSPRKQALTLYLMSGYGQMDQLLKKLGKYKSSVSCLYVKRLSDIDLSVLEEMIRMSIDIVKKRYEKYN